MRLNITIDQKLYRRLGKDLPSKEISAFISDAVRKRLIPDRKTLDAAYRAASRESWRQKFSSEWRTTEIVDWPE